MTVQQPDGGTRVLVIDDEEVVHASLQKILRKRGLEVTSVLAAQDGLELLERQTFALVITDLMMPGMNGIELMQELRDRGIEVPVVVITGYPTIRTAVQAMRLGSRDYVTKPFTRKELLGPVMRALRQERAEAAEERDPVADAPDAGSLVPGAVVVLRHHAWARFEQDGTFSIGVEQSFLGAAGAIVEVTLPELGSLQEQGAVGVTLVNAEGEDHGVALPLTGEVVAVNAEVARDAGRLSDGTWLVRLVPRQLDQEIGNLKLR